MRYSGPDPERLHELLAAIGVPSGELRSSVRLVGEPPVLQSPHRIALAGGLALLAQGAATAWLWEQRGGNTQEVQIEARDAVFALNPIPYFRRNGYLALDLGRHPAPAGGYFPTKDGRMFFITVHSPKLLNGTLRVLGCPNDRKAVTAAIARRHSDELEQAWIDAGLTGATVRTSQEWQRLPQGEAVRRSPLVEIERIGDAPPVPLRESARPLDDVRVADVTHVFAGTMLSRSLAEQGADVLHLGPIDAHLADPVGMAIVTGIGKRSAVLDYLTDGQDVLSRLLSGADILVQSWRPGVLDRHGFGPEQVAAIKPGVVYVSVNCFGYSGPWAGRGGFDPVALAATGMTAEEARRDTYKFSPPGILTDTIAAFLGAGAVAAVLVRRARVGGSWHVKLSLARIATWIQSLGLYPEGTRVSRLGQPDLRRMPTPYGILDYLPPALRYSETAAGWDKPPVPAGSSPAAWL